MRYLFLLFFSVIIVTSFDTFPSHSISSASFTHSKDGLNDSLQITSNAITNSNVEFANHYQLLYNALDFGDNPLKMEVFEKALLGFQNLKKSGVISPSSHLLTICDFSLSSNQKRLWVIDLEQSKVLFNSLVAHGKNTGEEYATSFSNEESSYQSSLGFYVTDTTYLGGNGYSLRLKGLDKGFNDNAEHRAIVMHGADYVSDNFAIQHKRIGRSWGCPALPKALAKPIINTIKNKSILFFYYPDQDYLASSQWLHTNSIAKN